MASGSAGAFNPSTFSSALFGTDIADYWFPVSQGGDIAFIYGVLKIMIERGTVDHDFIRDHSEQFEEVKSRAESLGWAELEKQSGLPRAAMEELADDRIKLIA